MSQMSQMSRTQLVEGWEIPRAGDLIAGKYVVDGKCGRGGLAVVLSATHPQLDQRVAIKMLLPQWADNPAVIERFLREGRAATHVKSEHVVRVFDVGRLDGGAPYLVLEYLEGCTLEEILVRNGPVPVPTAVEWLLQAAEAIGEAHTYGIVHRDLKPANLFLTARADGSPCVKVIDFGLSKLTDPLLTGANPGITRPNDIMGSPRYMAPEQLCASRDVDARADLWAMGVVLYELLTGRPPFDGLTSVAVCTDVMLREPAPPSSLRPGIPPEVDAIVLRCLRKNKDQRFAHVAELARALAPFGPPSARTSSERIIRTLEGRGSASWPPIPAPEPLQPGYAPDGASTPSSEGRLIPYVHPASPRVVFGSLLMLASMGGALLMWMYLATHPALVAQASQVRAGVGVTAPQGTAQVLVAPVIEHAAIQPR
ncbi:MAG TPA: serine/threonine-protein kinase [Polyangiaceae bacterium]